MNQEDVRLSALLRQSRGSPPLPPRFQDNVWRRIEDSDLVSRPDNWLDVLAALILRPRFAIVVAAALIVAGAIFGVQAGSRQARETAQLQYLNSVAPPAMR